MSENLVCDKAFYDTAEFLPPDAPTDPAGVMSQMLGEIKGLRSDNEELRRLIVETRQMQLGQAAHMESLENRIKNLEARMGQ